MSTTTGDVRMRLDLGRDGGLQTVAVMRNATHDDMVRIAQEQFGVPSDAPDSQKWQVVFLTVKELRAILTTAKRALKQEQAALRLAEQEGT